MPTTEETPSTELVLCSFCGKTRHEASKIVAAPGVYTCDECVHLSNEIVSEAT